MRTANRPDPKAYFPIALDSCLLIYDIEHGIDDQVLFSVKTGSDLSRIRKSVVRYNSRGEAYFRAGPGYGYTRIYFSDCLRMK